MSVRDTASAGFLESSTRSEFRTIHHYESVLGARHEQTEAGGRKTKRKSPDQKRSLFLPILRTHHLDVLLIGSNDVLWTIGSHVVDGRDAYTDNRPL